MCRLNAALTARWIAGTLRNDVRSRTRRAPAAMSRLADAAIDADVGAAEPVDRLLRVADDEQGTRPHRDVERIGGRRGPRLVGGESQQQLRLQRIGVLELVDQQVAEPPLELGAHLARRRAPGRGRGSAGRGSRRRRRAACAPRSWRWRRPAPRAPAPPGRRRPPRGRRPGRRRGDRAPRRPSPGARPCGTTRSDCGRCAGRAPCRRARTASPPSRRSRRGRGPGAAARRPRRCESAGSR